MIIRNVLRKRPVIIGSGTPIYGWAFDRFTQTRRSVLKAGCTCVKYSIRVRTFDMVSSAAMTGAENVRRTALSSLATDGVDETQSVSSAH